MVDLEAETRNKLGQSPFAQYDSDLAETTPITIPARDGLKLPGFLTRPKGLNGPGPMVLLVHGGPALHDRWGYDNDIQFLANRGYTVLRVNFRGSTGFGRAFRDAGDKEMGRKMQDDLDDAVDWAISHGHADPDNIAIMGASYGGFAALTAGRKGKGRYKAAIALAPVSDMAHQTENHPKFWSLNIQDWYRYTGDPVQPGAPVRLADISPINHASEFSVPFLLVHGDSDTIVDPQQSRKMEQALRAAGKDVTVLWLKREGHGLARWQSRVVFWRAVERFLAGHIGGRDAGWDYVELVPLFGF